MVLMSGYSKKNMAMEKNKMNKQALKDKVNKEIPIFKLREVALFDDNGNVCKNEEYTAITEENRTKPLAFVTNRYNLVQFNEIFIPIIDEFTKLEGNCRYFNGFGIMDIFPEDDALKENNCQYGLTIYNSVNGTCAINIKFCVKHNNRLIVMPSKVTGFKKVHSGKALKITQKYVKMLSKIGSSWKYIMMGLATSEVNGNNLTDILGDLKLGKKIDELITDRFEYGNCQSLWDLFLITFDYIAGKEFISEVNQRKKLDSLCEKIYEYSMIEAI